MVSTTCVVVRKMYRSGRSCRVVSAVRIEIIVQLLHSMIAIQNCSQFCRSFVMWSTVFWQEILLT